MAIKRSEMNISDTWDLEAIYKSEEEFNNDYLKVVEEIKKLKEISDQTFDNSENLYNFLTLQFMVSRMLDKLYNYAHLNHDIETKKAKFIEAQEKVINLYSEFEEVVAFFEPGFLQLDKELVDKFYLENSNLNHYKRYLDEVFRYKKHTLNKNEEKILAILSTPISSFNKIYSSLFDADIKFPFIKVNKKKVEIDSSNYIKYLSNNNRKVRIDAFNAMYDTLEKYQYSITSILANHIDAMNRHAKIRNFNSSLEESLFNDDISVNVYNNLINTVNNNLGSLQEYYKLKKKLLGLDELHFYDIYTNAIKKSNTKYSYEEAKEIVKKSLSPLGEYYGSILTKAFNERWIDVYHNSDKTSGAYSSGCYDTYPYVLLNYEGETNDLSTLAHELGHSIHSYLSNKNNDYIDSSYHIFVAEIASTVNELLLSKYMIKNAKNNLEKISILDHLLDLFKGTLFRQTMFAEFEKEISLYAKDNVLTNEYLSDTYLNLNKKYFKDALVIDDKIKYEWMRIEHFYYNFYVYKYATGISIASYIVEKLLSDETYLNKYLKFLSLGDSMSVLDELKEVDVDASKSEIIESAIKFFNDTLSEYKKLQEEVGEK